MRPSLPVRLLPIALGLALAWAPRLDGAENLLVNGGFDDHLTGWSRVDEVSYSAFGASAPGSAKVAAAIGPVGTDVLIQCVPIEPLRLYDLSAAVYLPIAPAASGGVSLRLQFHPQPGCQGPVIRGGGPLDFEAKTPSSWQSAERRRIPAPEGTASALLVVVAHTAGDDPYAFFLDDLVLRRSDESEVLVLPTAATVSGARGERFQTDVWVHNPVPADRMFAVRIGCGGCGLTPIVHRIGPNETRFFPDLLASVLGRRNEAVPVEILYDPRNGPLVATARVVTVNPESPGNGAALPFLPRDGARTRATYLGLSGARGDAAGAYRVNAGAYNPGSAEVDVTFRLHDGDGRELGSVSRRWGPGEWYQLNDVVAAAGAEGTSTEGAYLTFESRLPVFPFVLAVDNRSGDGTWVPPASAEED